MAKLSPSTMPTMSIYSPDRRCRKVTSDEADNLRGIAPGQPGNNIGHIGSGSESASPVFVAHAFDVWNQPVRQKIEVDVCRDRFDDEGEDDRRRNIPRPPKFVPAPSQTPRIRATGGQDEAASVTKDGARQMDFLRQLQQFDAVTDDVCFRTVTGLELYHCDFRKAFFSDPDVLRRRLPHCFDGMSLATITLLNRITGRGLVVFPSNVRWGREWVRYYLDVRNFPASALAARVTSEYLPPKPDHLLLSLLDA
ncbi:hypothetical protein FN846DRAFT_1000413 [Sphaerosporella brunnea]|uniref:Uncharacterized protein n=1 Tax=Sphaerosporella brunnea TaxID=1250544 RepID=A0A5J5EID0_9PEZI|nr:hypothetical protein FN846DRAFT_1000413 [Sphaerosporella brunnea]